MFSIKGLPNRIYCAIARLRLKNKNFTIISNDCWGGGVYEDLKIQYSTPVVGLFFHAPCYIEFLENLNNLINVELIFVSKSKYTVANDYRDKMNHHYPIAKLQNIEIHFLHYHSQEEAISNWNRRKARINFDNLYFKFSYSELCTDELINRFNQLPIASNKKVMFTSKKLRNYNWAVFLRKYQGKSNVGDIYNDRWAYRIDFDVINWLNK